MARFDVNVDFLTSQRCPRGFRNLDNDPVTSQQCSHGLIHDLASTMGKVASYQRRHTGAIDAVTIILGCRTPV